eukprot:CAMPEP_0198576844 /NCGR_PEP_ID=MMETSP1462-20131121/118153_1 /TAXON_ID=1333877 /ORGANISM="Brandtodinium nutriculum, Strain RCC3387" /LENGTH=180 /DNA_ID=CAMNT_0044308113 /DNA_START=219 /DNA_END=758 /DNA_ORIENTATION=-
MPWRLVDKGAISVPWRPAGRGDLVDLTGPWRTSILGALVDLDAPWRLADRGALVELGVPRRLVGRGCLGDWHGPPPCFAGGGGLVEIRGPRHFAGGVALAALHGPWRLVERGNFGASSLRRLGNRGAFVNLGGAGRGGKKAGFGASSVACGAAAKAESAKSCSAAPLPTLKVRHGARQGG